MTSSVKHNGMDIHHPVPVAPYEREHLPNLRWYVIHANKRVPELVGPFKNEAAAIEWGMGAIGKNDVDDFDWFIRLLHIPMDARLVTCPVSRPV